MDTTNSCTCQIEICFSILARRVLWRGSFVSVEDISEHILNLLLHCDPCQAISLDYARRLPQEASWQDYHSSRFIWCKSHQGSHYIICAPHLISEIENTSPHNVRIIMTVYDLLENNVFIRITMIAVIERSNHNAQNTVQPDSCGSFPSKSTV